MSDQNGMTKREEFAMAAMQGLIAKSPIRSFANEVAVQAVEYADALLDELEKEPE